MGKLLELLKGKKTYLVALLMAIGTFAQVVGWIDSATWVKIEAFLAAMGIATMRAGIKNG